ncbi:hypothetical protein PAMP_009714 [Pampus punctatissimus]
MSTFTMDLLQRQVVGESDNLQMLCKSRALSLLAKRLPLALCCQLCSADGKKSSLPLPLTSAEV